MHVNFNLAQWSTWPMNHIGSMAARLPIAHGGARQVHMRCVHARDRKLFTRRALAEIDMLLQVS